MAEISDEQMKQWLSTAVPYTVVLLHQAAGYETAPDRDAIIWEHGRRNMALQIDGILPVVCPVPDDTGLAGIGIFAVGLEETARIMDEDPGVRAGLFTYEVHPSRSIPGSVLPRPAAP